MTRVRNQIRNILARRGKFTFGRTEIKFRIRATSITVCVQTFGTWEDADFEVVVVKFMACFSHGGMLPALTLGL